MSAEKDDLATELRRLLEVEAARVDPPDRLKEQVRSRLMADARLHRAPAGRSRRAGRLLGSPKLWIAAGIGLSVAGLSWRINRPGSPPPATTSQPRIQPSPTVATEPPAAPLNLELPPSAPEPGPIDAKAPSRRRRHEGPQRSPSIETSLARERQLIEKARAELHAGRPGNALTTLHEHEHEFPDGILVEERLGLQIEVLAARGELAVARQRALEFRSRFPGSPLQSAIDSALQRTSQ